nr:MAG TPA: hypothetical protein [Caudoviricetes sp.]
MKRLLLPPKLTRYRPSPAVVWGLSVPVWCILEKTLVHTPTTFSFLVSAPCKYQQNDAPSIDTTQDVELGF